MGKQHDALRATLARLHEQLGDAESLDPEARELLRATLHEIEQALEGPGERAEGEASLAERLGELAQRFEGTHPTLAAAVGRVVDTLANLGI
jgi:hypothetical protein